jgi:transposase-like protein
MVAVDDGEPDRVDRFIAKIIAIGTRLIMALSGTDLPRLNGEQRESPASYCLSKRGGQEMGRMEVITRTERRRTYSEAEKAAVLAEASAPGVTVREVSQRLGIAESLIYNWRSAQRKAASIASEPLQFIPYGVVTDTVASEPSMALTPATPAPAPPQLSPPTAPAGDLVRPHPGTRPSGIDIDLPTGVRLSVDSYVNEKALARVLRALGHAS